MSISIGSTTQTGTPVASPSPTAGAAAPPPTAANPGLGQDVVRIGAPSTSPVLVPDAPPTRPPQGATSFLGGIGSFFGGVGKWVLGPYLGYIGNKGATTFLHPARKADGPAPDTLGMPYQKISFTSHDGKTPLSGWYIPAATPSTRTVVIAHGFGDEQSQFMQDFAPWLHAAGYNVVTFDFRNSGGSGGDHTSMGFEEKQDLQAAVDQALQLGAKKVAVMGVSMGGATAIEEAAQDPRVNAVVDDCAFDTVLDAIRPRVGNARQDVGPLKVPYPFVGLASQAIAQKVQQDLGEPVLTDDPLHAVPALADRPLFIIHGAADNETLPVDSRNLFAADPAQAVSLDDAGLSAPGAKKALWMVPNAKHAGSYATDPTGYQHKVLTFLQSALA